MGPHTDRREPIHFRVQWLIGGTAVVLAVGLAFAAGHLASPETGPLPAEAVLTVGIFGAALIVCQLMAQLFVLTRAARSDELSESLTADLDHRDAQLRLLSRLSAILNGECRSRRIIRGSLDFLVDEMGAGSVSFWDVDAAGQVTAPVLARNATGGAAAQGIFAEAERGILAGSAVRERRPVVVDGPGGDARHLSSGTPRGAFALLLPCSAGRDCLGLIEVHAGGWAPHHWESIDNIAGLIGVALARGREFEDMQQQADIDFVTGLFNHRYVQTYLHRLLRDSTSRDSHAAVICLDVDNFKAYNDSLGHGAGDRVLQIVAQQLKLMTDRAGIVGRSGGDEFTIVLPGHTAEDAQAFIEVFQDWLAQQSPLINGVFRIHVSCGYAVFPDDAVNHHELVAAADARLYRAKHSAAKANGHISSDEPEDILGVYGLLDRLVDTIDGKDAYTRAHCERTAEYAVAFAQTLGLSTSAQKALRLAALLHDVGKIGVPDHILRKPGPLSADEFQIMKHQVNVATNLIVDIPHADEVRRLVQHHHERWDGAGYPDGLQADQIPYLARVLSVAEAFAAVTLDRPYRRGMPFVQACKELANASGSQFDPALVKAFIEMVDQDSAQLEASAHAAPSPAA